MEVRQWVLGDEWLTVVSSNDSHVEVLQHELILIGNDFIKLGASRIAAFELPRILSSTKSLKTVDNIHQYVTMYNDEVANKHGMGDRYGDQSVGHTEAARGLALNFGVKIKRIE